MHQHHCAREGYLLLADISGYTQFLTGTELEHAQAIIRELTTLLRERLAPPMTFVQLEGDAVFCYADTPVFRDGENLIELIEVCYLDFSNRLLNMARNTTCPCSACAAIGSLDLKFVCHHGSFIVDIDADRVDLVGPDVILVHRLLKNNVRERTGIEAYALLTDACLRQLPKTFELPRHQEHYESFDVTTVGVHDLKPVVVAMRAARRTYVGSGDADCVFSFDVPVPAVAAWKYYLDPVERQRWICRFFSAEPDRATRNNQGRIGQGAAMHCNHGPGSWRWEFVDWHPFAYVTHDVVGRGVGRYLGVPDQVNTFEFVPTADGGTPVVHRVRLKNRKKMAVFAFRIQRPYLNAIERWRHRTLLRIIAEDKAN